MPSELLTERRGRTLVLTLSGPSTRNALSPQALVAGIEALSVAESDPEVRCVVLRGDGEHFCSGGDLERIAATHALGEEEGRPAQRQSIERLGGFIEALRTIPLPVIAAVEGFAVGGGFSLALACDLIVAAEDARFMMSYGRIGLSPDGGGSRHLLQRLPRALALQHLWLPEPMKARELAQWGLVNHVCEHGQALSEALQLTDRLARTARGAVASAKELVELAPGRTLRDQLDAEAAHFLDNFFSPDGAEGLAAFHDKRAPRFR